MSKIVDVFGAKITALADAIVFNNRIGRRSLNAGVGFSGGCLPKDIRAFTAHAEALGRGDSVAFLKDVDAINLRQRQRVVPMTLQVLDKPVYTAKVAVLGLRVKPVFDGGTRRPSMWPCNCAALALTSYRSARGSRPRA